MKASELINHLNNLISENGDLEIRLSNTESDILLSITDEDIVYEDSEEYGEIFIL